MTREEINAFADAVKSQLLHSDAAILVQVGAYPPSIECDEKSCTATIEAVVGRKTLSFTGHAIDLNNAIWLARGKLRVAREKHAAAKALGRTPNEIGDEG